MQTYRQGTEDGGDQGRSQEETDSRRMNNT